MLPPRSVTRTYRDPLDRIWLDTARAVGLTVVRRDDAFAATNGQGVLAIATPSALDRDDSLAQMIFHEICHWLIEGEDARAKSDWGLDNETDLHFYREHACLRLQAALASRYGLRTFFAPTTDFRGFYDDLPLDPLIPRWHPTVSLAIAGLRRVAKPPWSPHLARALERTSEVAEVMRRALELTPTADPSDLWASVEPAATSHRTGLPLSAAHAERTCSECAWHVRSGTKKPRSRCRQAEGALTAPEAQACERFEPALDCQACGACCREAYHSVTISAREPFIRRHPDLVVVRERYTEIRRTGDRCAALEGGAVAVGGNEFTPYACRHYDERPSPCRGFTAHSDNCLTARRRVGLSL